jgi:hypothetical protein
MYEQAWQCLECGREYQNEPARCQCGQGDLKEIRREIDDAATEE